MLPHAAISSIEGFHSRRDKFRQKENTMKNNFRKLATLASFVVALMGAALALANFASAQDSGSDRFRVNSATFENNSTMPLSTIYNYQVNGVNVCSLNGSPGGDQSPELSWTPPARYAQFRGNSVRHLRTCYALGHVQHPCHDHRASPECRCYRKQLRE